jgi:hypothetical protein
MLELVEVLDVVMLTPFAFCFQERPGFNRRADADAGGNTIVGESGEPRIRRREDCAVGFY